MDAERQHKITRIAYSIITAVIICGAMALLYGGCGRTDNAAGTGADGASTAQQVSRITELNELAERENQSARAAVSSADERAAEAADLNHRVTERFEVSKELLGQIRADNQRAKQLLDELIREAESGPAQGETN